MGDVPGGTEKFPVWRWYDALVVTCGRYPARVLDAPLRRLQLPARLRDRRLVAQRGALRLDQRQRLRGGRRGLDGRGEQGGAARPHRHDRV